MNTEYEGKCAFASALGKTADEAPNGHQGLAVEMDGRRYLFSNPVARMLWRLTFAPRGKAAARLGFAAALGLCVLLLSFALSGA
jgi:hypothetical protein